MSCIKGLWKNQFGDIIQFSDMYKGEIYHLDYNYDSEKKEFKNQEKIVLRKTNETHFYISQSEILNGNYIIVENNSLIINNVRYFKHDS